MTRVGQPSPASEVSDEEDFRFHDFHDHPLLTPNSLQGALKKLGVSPIDNIEEANLIMDNGNVIHFSHPKSAGLHSLQHLWCERTQRDPDIHSPSCAAAAHTGST